MFISYYITLHDKNINSTILKYFTNEKSDDIIYECLSNASPCNMPFMANDCIEWIDDAIWYAMSH